MQAFAYLLDNDISKMMNILYRTDVDEEKLKSLLISNSELPSAEVIAEAYLRRQKEKIETRKKYSRSFFMMLLYYYFLISRLFLRLQIS